MITENLDNEKHIGKCLQPAGKAEDSCFLRRTEIQDYLKTMPHFGMLPDEELEKIAAQTLRQRYSKGRYLAVQDTTRLSHIYVIRCGGVSVHWEKGNSRLMVGYMLSDEVFGGISLLMNDGISLRTVIVEEETEAYLIPRQIFLEMCCRHKDFSSTFVRNFGNNTIDTELDSIINSGLIKFYLSNTRPFSILPGNAIDFAEQFLSLVHYPLGSQLFPHSESRVSYLYLLHKGSAKSFRHDNDYTFYTYSHRVLNEGDIYGGSDILFNSGYAGYLLEMTEDTYFYLLPETAFLYLCDNNRDFMDYFVQEYSS